MVTLSAKRRRQELLSSALACVQNVLRHCMQTKPDNMLLRNLCFDYPRSKTCSSPLTSVLHVRQDAPEVATVTRTIKLTLKQKNSLPSDVVEKEKKRTVFHSVRGWHMAIALSIIPADKNAAWAILSRYKNLIYSLIYLFSSIKDPATLLDGNNISSSQEIKV